MLAGLVTAFLALPRWVHIALGVVALIALAFTLHRCAIDDAVEADREAAQGQVAETALGAERAANRADAARQAEIQANDAMTRKAIDNATAANPEITPAGPVSRAAADSLRGRSTGARPSAR